VDYIFWENLVVEYAPTEHRAIFRFESSIELL
jgi:hypothetical protein